MKLLCVGVNWKTPVAVREKMAFDSDARARGLAELRSDFGDVEFALLCTCNRTEIYAASSDSGRSVSVDDLTQFLSRSRDVSLEEFVPHLFAFDGPEAVRHLFEVAAGLDSLVLGETQILGQVKEAYQDAVACESAGPILHALFQKSLSAGKRVRTETGISKGRFSIAGAAVDYIRGVFEVFHDKTVLLIGAGKMAELTATHVMDLRPARLIVVNRSQEAAERLAARKGGVVRPFSQLREALVDADIVVSSTAAPAPIVTAREFPQIMKERRQRLIAIVDIAVPRDFDAAVGELDNVLLWNIDDLESVRQQAIRSRRTEFDAAERILEEEQRLFDAAAAELRSGPIISRLEREYQRIIDDELAWLWPQLNGVSDVDREKIRHFAHRIKNKLLHPPKTAIREDTRHGRHGVLETVQRLFGLVKDE